MWQYNYSDELYHHGILGQKWGVRRYQKPDGSLTLAGKRRLAKDDYKLETDSAKQKYEKKLASLSKKGKGKNSVEAAKAKAERDTAISEAYAKLRKERYEANQARKQEKADKKAEKEARKMEKTASQEEKSTAGKDFAKAFLLTSGVVLASRLINKKLNPDGSDDGPEIEIPKMNNDSEPSSSAKKYRFKNSYTIKKNSVNDRSEWEFVDNRNWVRALTSGSNFVSGLLGSGNSGSLSGSTPMTNLLPPPGGSSSSSTALVPIK